MSIRLNLIFVTTVHNMYCRNFMLIKLFRTELISFHAVNDMPQSIYVCYF